MILITNNTHSNRVVYAFSSNDVQLLDSHYTFCIRSMTVSSVGICQNKHWQIVVYDFSSNYVQLFRWQILYSVEDSVKSRNLAKQALTDSCVRFLLKLHTAFPMTDFVFGRRLRQA